MSGYGESLQQSSGSLAVIAIKAPDSLMMNNCAALRGFVQLRGPPTHLA